ncbi:hypothetical protein HF325_005810 [Metschnikowia pulcherrima]|uniref:Uncharacterized protein n=1 Tax=Metschnikowia pulcherrima TaxID=27326 RepID=A0A8H7GP80_9ASCO|nr:hypothetical protein HF325_005810 [Metschnikowia pulcherrima]
MTTYTTVIKGVTKTVTEECSTTEASSEYAATTAIASSAAAQSKSASFSQITSTSAAPSVILANAAGTNGAFGWTMIGAESIGGPGANSHADVSVSGESRGRPNILADGSAAEANSLVGYDLYNGKNTSAHENVEDCDIRITKASANFTHGEREENCDSVFSSDFASCNKRGTNDTNVGTKKKKTPPVPSSD